MARGLDSSAAEPAKPNEDGQPDPTGEGRTEVDTAAANDARGVNTVPMKDSLGTSENAINGGDAALDPVPAAVQRVVDGADAQQVLDENPDIRLTLYGLTSLADEARDDAQNLAALEALDPELAATIRQLGPIHRRSGMDSSGTRDLGADRPEDRSGRPDDDRTLSERMHGEEQELR